MNKDIVNYLLENGYLVSPDAFIENDFDYKTLLKEIKSKEKPLIINKDIINILKQNKINNEINWLEFENSYALSQKGKNGKAYDVFLNILSRQEVASLDYNGVKETEQIFDEEEEETNAVVVLKSYQEDAKKIEVKDFVAYYRVRYNILKNILQNRQELINLTSISKIINKKSEELVSLIGIVYEKRVTKNNNIILTVEDITGVMKCCITKNNKQIYEDAKNVVEDEVIGIRGYARGDIIFVNSLIFPDMPVKELKKISKDVYVAFISDIHVGSKNFLYDDLMKFIDWINGKNGNLQQREVAKNLKYIFVVGDLIAGCGVYPGQEKDLLIKDITKQYELLAEIFKQIRDDIKIIVCPGNHDALRIAEPQPSVYKDFAKALYDIKNVIMVGNPSLINIHSSKEFPGFDVLVYHGASFHYFIDNIESLRLGKARDNPGIVSKFLLQKRHLAPTHQATVKIPDPKEDFLIIDKVPDIFVNGDMHRSHISTYNNINIINCSCWESKTEFQEKTGNNPDPGKVPLLNLKTREVKILRFYKEDGM